MKPSNLCDRISASNSLFRSLDHPISTTVLTSCPGSSRLSGRGTHSSSSSRMRLEQFPGEVERRDRLFALHARKIVKELVEAVSRFEVVQQGLHRYSCSHEHRHPAQDLRVTVDDGAQRAHDTSPTCAGLYTDGRSAPNGPCSYGCVPTPVCATSMESTTKAAGAQTRFLQLSSEPGIGQDPLY